MAGLTARNLPFEVGHCVEVKSFLAGFRGAWFRCKIKSFRRNKSKHLGVELEYIDFPDEKIKWTKLYQKYNKKKHLMIRPCFPPVYRDCQQPDITTTNEVVVLVRDTWKVGDWVDWWATDCYWSGRLTEKLGHEMFQLELWPSPEGEGLIYEACSKDFRPSLNWSIEHGWEVPAPQGGGDFHPCAQLILPMEVRAVDKDQEKDQAAPGAAAQSSHNLVDSIPTFPESELLDKEHSSPIISGEKESTEPVMDLDVMHGGICRATSSDGVASLHVKSASDDMAENTDASDDRPPKKMRSETNISIDLGTMESEIVDLEELVNRIKWIKSILKPSPNSVQAPWEFIEQTGPPTLM